MTKALIHDLKVKAYTVLPERGTLGKAKDVIDISGCAVFKREGNLYKVVVRMKYDLTGEYDWITQLNEAVESFTNQCEKISKHWKLMTPEESIGEGTHGLIIMQEPFEIK
jgi:hypothetical protein